MERDRRVIDGRLLFRIRRLKMEVLASFPAPAIGAGAQTPLDGMNF